MDKNTRDSLRRILTVSVIAALILFALGGTVIKFSPQLNKFIALTSAQKGEYESAVARVMSIDDEFDEIKKSGLYEIALIMFGNNDYQNAIDTFGVLGDYRDSMAMINECKLQMALLLLEQSDYQSAAEILSDIFNYSNASQVYNECQYKRADTESKNGNWFGAVQLFWSIKDYADAQKKAESILFENTGTNDVSAALGISGNLSNEQLELSFSLAEARKEIKNGRISVGFFHTVGLCNNGTVVACGNNDFGQCDTEKWTDVVQIAAGAYHTAALLNDGTVVACGNNEFGQCNVENWSDIIQIAANDYNTFALRKDGTVISCGYHSSQKTENWHNVGYIFADSYTAGCLYNNGHILTTHASGDISPDAFYVDAAASAGYSLALTSDGKVVSGIEIPENWTNIIAVYASLSYAAVINSDGRAEVFCFRTKETINSAPDAAVVSVSLGSTHFALLYSDGSVETFGADDYGQCSSDSWMLQ